MRYGTCYVSEFQFNFSKPQLLLLTHVGLTWLDTQPANSKLLTLSIMDDIFSKSKSYCGVATRARVENVNSGVV